jgi:hypothetical protein
MRRFFNQLGLASSEGHISQLTTTQEKAKSLLVKLESAPIGKLDYLLRQSFSSAEVNSKLHALIKAELDAHIRRNQREASPDR